MIYKKHDSVFNYHNASGSKDQNAVEDLILNDIADTLVHHRQLFIDGLVNSGVVATRDMTNPELIRLLIANITTNRALAENLSKLIGYKNTKSAAVYSKTGSAENFYGQHHNAYGGLSAYGGLGFNASQRGYSGDIHNAGYLGIDGVSNADGSGDVGSLANLANSIIGLFTRKNQAAAQQATTEQKLLDLATAKMNAAAATVTSHKTIFLVSGVLIIGIVGLIIYKARK